MFDVNPMEITGPWRRGYVLDYHTLGSVHVGDDEFGRPIFETTRTQLGERLYRLKYKGDVSAVAEIVDAAAAFLAGWAPPIDLLVAVPASDQRRRSQPLLALAPRLAERLGLPFAPNGVRVHSGRKPLKDVFDQDERLRLLEGAFMVSREVVEGRSVLLLDDLYRSGATLSAVTEALVGAGGAADVFALALTRTRTLR